MFRITRPRVRLEKWYRVNGTVLPWSARDRDGFQEESVHARVETAVTLPPRAVANAGFPYDAKLADARRFLASRGITAVRPVYGTVSTASPSAAERAWVRWLPQRSARGGRLVEGCRAGGTGRTDGRPLATD